MLYQDILANSKSKEKYQLLCANCNWIKRFERKEHRGYKKIREEYYYQLPAAILTGCINFENGIMCKDCDVTNCYERVPNKYIFGLTHNKV